MERLLGALDRAQFDARLPQPIRSSCWALSLRLRGLTSPLFDPIAEADEAFALIDRRLDPTHRCYAFAQDEIVHEWLANRPPLARQMTVTELHGALRELEREEKRRR